ncbi:MAG TPA: N-acetylmuramoyl-L-alanine amidase [Desulfosalsimonadaceae bacterium]|nr:N-acetylmuramoyl-L-alanine amidase [Desulfosalsimonadaceae bacterium]
MGRFRIRQISVIILVSLSVVVVYASLPSPCRCESARQLYFKAESCYRQLTESPSEQKYRSNWKQCIAKFSRVYELDPDGRWAAAGLFMKARLYAELYEHSYKPDDIRTARSIYSRVIRNYPESEYRKRSKAAIKELPEVGPSAKEAYFDARAAYRELQKHPERQKFRSHWKTCIEGFASVYRQHPASTWAPAAMFMCGRVYEGLYAHSYNQKDQKQAAEIYRRLIRDYPDSQYRRKSEVRLEKIGDVIGRVIAKSENTGEAKEPVTVTGIRYWSNPDYTRVVIDASGETGYDNNLLKKDPSIHKPYPRLYVDLANARLGDVEKKIPINDSLLRAARAGQYRKDTVRVVVDIKSFSDYEIFSLNNPFRIVIDVRGRGGGGSQRVATAPSTQGDMVVTPFCLGVDRIVIDPGHGGKDYGAPGYLSGVHEKMVALEISRKLAKKLRQELGCEVLLTRRNDKYLTLEERTAIANTEKADLFLSIHANAARNHRAYGIETYFLNLTTDESAISVAARENATSKKNISELDSILQDLLNNARINESSRLATCVQDSLCSYLSERYSRINNKGVKQAPFYVLLGAQMPSILVETSFISNPRECRRLTNEKYQSAVCAAIVKGVKRYVDDMRPKAGFVRDQNSEGEG